VVIAAFNEEKFLGNCLESLEKQDFKEVGFDKDFNIGI
jgi:glycosyltransferase involved in cell wall biosynthesis